MRGRVTLAFTCLLLALPLVAGTCGGGTGSGGAPSVREIDDPVIVVPPPDPDFEFADPTPLCGAVSSAFPPGFVFVPGDPDHVWMLDFTPPTFIAFRVDGARPQIAGTPFVLPFDSDGDGRDEFVLAPILDDIAIEAADLALITASSYEEVIFFSPQSRALRRFDVSVPASFAPSDNPLLPAPGTTASRTALSTFACVRPPPGALDSRGDPIAVSVPAAGFCDPSVPSYLASFTSGAVIAAGHLFVSTSNLGNDAGSSEPQYLPGSVLVYDISMNASTVSPNARVPVIGTTAFNPTQVTRHAVGSREFVLVTASGAVGIEDDDPATLEIEGGALALSDGAIDVIDAQTLELVATWPLGLAALSGEPLAIDASGRVAFVGSVSGRNLFAVDLAPLATLPASVSSPIVLDSVVFDADDPFAVPPLPSGGAPAASCPGAVLGASFNAAGDLLYASESCDGTLSVVDVDLSGAAPVPVPADRFTLLEVLAVVSPLRIDTLGEPRAPARVAVRPGEPGIDFSGRDLLFSIGLDEGALCSIGVESGGPPPSPALPPRVVSQSLAAPSVLVRGAEQNGSTREFRLRVSAGTAKADLVVADLSGHPFARFELRLRAAARDRVVELLVTPAEGERAVLVAHESQDGRRSAWRRVLLDSADPQGVLQ